MQYTIQIPFGINHASYPQLTADTPEKLYDLLNVSHVPLSYWVEPIVYNNWRGLTLSFTPSLKQLQHIVWIQPNLLWLDLSNTGVTDASPLSGLQVLEELNLDNTGVTDVSFVSALKSLKKLYLARTGITGITDLEPLSGLVALKTLNLSGTGVIDVSALSRLLAMRNLNLSNTGVTGIPLLPGLRKLNLSNTGVTDIPLLPELRELDLCYTAITDVTHLPALEFLWTNIGQLKRISAPINSEYVNMVKEISPELTDLRQPNIAQRVKDHLLISRHPHDISNSSHPGSSLTLFLQRARHEDKRTYEILKNMKDSQNLVTEEAILASWIKADMLASIEGHWTMIEGESYPDLFTLAQKEWAEKECQSKTYFQDLRTKGFSEETARIYQLVCLRYLCRRGAPPPSLVEEVLNAISCEATSRDYYATYSFLNRTFDSLKMTDSLLRDFFLDHFWSRPPDHSYFNSYREDRFIIRCYKKPEQASRMLKIYRGNIHLSLLERLLLKFPLGFSQDD